ncbi:MAG TPA: TIGR03118 family protein [Terracidiphilus sp.]|jgi:uncharacterized protein (TIGR03118 family)
MFSRSFAKFAPRVIPIAAGLLCLSAGLAAQPTQHYAQTNLVSDQPGMAAATDPNLVNAWGMSRGTATPWWVSDNGMGVTTLYTGTGSIVPLVVTIPGAESGQSGTPTGQVFNGTTDFNLASGAPAKFIFATEDGTISGWNPAVQPTTAVIKVNTHSASVFKGLAMATVGDPQGTHSNYLYAADFRKGRIAVYDTKFHLVRFGRDGDRDDDDNAFRDERIPHGFAPFNVQNIGGNLYVAFAKQDSEKHDEVDGPGLGYVDVFSPTGRLLQRFEHSMWLNGPWGLAQAPSDFGANSHDILVGQFGSGNILSYDAASGRLRGPLYGTDNNPVTIDGLWGIAFGSGGASGPATTLYFTAGPGGEQHGLFGTLTAVENLLGGDL